jgi:tRNA 5-methylaminomethyl-2-thiouridine biosynthesis bifunctional protein
MQNTPRSKEFDDVYFSAADGLAETKHVFLQGNGLPERWKGRSQFTIAETGFGTGLNFLAAWKLFRETKEAGAHLDFISVEKFPLNAGQIADYLSGWNDELRYEMEILRARYPAETKDAQKIFMDESVTLTIYFDDVNTALPLMQQKVDCWFLDGFKPASNPDMWTHAVFQNMARLSNPGATFATFTAAGVVKRGLKNAGFHVEKRDGFGWKRDMLAGYFP